VSTVTSRDGTVIDFDRYGEGPAVIFIAGTTQYRTTDPVTSQTARLLGEAGFTAVVYDRRGRGRSGDTQPWSPVREIEDLAALIAMAGGEATVYSSSSGATIALAAAQADVGVRALALYEPPFFQGGDHVEQLTVLRPLLAQGKLDEAMRYNLTAVIGLPPQAVAGMAQMPMWPDMVAVAPTVVYDLTNLDEVNLVEDWRQHWSNVTVPVVVYSGDQTFPGMPEAADAVAATLPSARREILPGQGHGPSSEAIVPVLLTFLRGQ
jgi:pimeloyl-ACP methyl ester carboxylesterase